jgi:hypothetical protein
MAVVPGQERSDDGQTAKCGMRLMNVERDKFIH